MLAKHTFVAEPGKLDLRATSQFWLARAEAAKFIMYSIILFPYGAEYCYSYCSIIQAFVSSCY